jgi:hypothetical protein
MGGRARERVSIEEVPMCKRIAGTMYTVDCFSFPVEGCTHYFLSHFHADHYTNLHRSFEHPVFCSVTTSRLVQKRIGARTIPLEMHRTYELDRDHHVRCIEAHHCPGAVCFIFRICGEYILHTGDFRALECFYEQDLHFRYSKIYLDNTYEGFRELISQKRAIHRVLDIMKRKMRSHRLAPLRHEWCFCTYLVGKERLFLSVAEYFGMSVRVSKEKMSMYECFSEYTRDLLNDSVMRILQTYGERRHREVLVDYGFKVIQVTRREMDAAVEDDLKPFGRITTGRSRNEIRIMSMADLAPSRLNRALEDSDADLAVVFCGTGWRDEVKCYDWAREDRRVIKRGIEVVCVPYSEHSSCGELERFRERMVCDEIVNTVNNRAS